MGYEDYLDPGMMPQDADTNAFADWIATKAKNALMPEEYQNVFGPMLAGQMPSQEVRDVAHQRAVQSLPDQALLFGNVGQQATENLMKGLAYIPQQVYRHEVSLPKAVPGLAEQLDKMGNPIRNTINYVRGKLADLVPSMEGELAPAMAELTQGETTLRSNLPLAQKLLGKYNYEIPYIADTSQYPVTLLGRTPETLGELQKLIFPKEDVAPFNGLYSYVGQPRSNSWLADVVLGLKKAFNEGTTALHEDMGHMGLNRMRGTYGKLTQNLPLEDIAIDRKLAFPEGKPALGYADTVNNWITRGLDQYPKEAAALRQMGYPEQKIPEEMYARYVANQAPMTEQTYPLYESKFGQGMMNAGARHVHPSLTGDRPSLVASQSILELLQSLTKGEYPGTQIGNEVTMPYAISEQGPMTGYGGYAPAANGQAASFGHDTYNAGSSLLGYASYPGNADPGVSVASQPVGTTTPYTPSSYATTQGVSSLIGGMLGSLEGNSVAAEQLKQLGNPEQALTDYFNTTGLSPSFLGQGNDFFGVRVPLGQIPSSNITLMTGSPYLPQTAQRTYVPAATASYNNTYAMAKAPAPSYTPSYNRSPMGGVGPGWSLGNQGYGY